MSTSDYFDKTINTTRTSFFVVIVSRDRAGDGSFFRSCWRRNNRKTTAVVSRKSRTATRRDQGELIVLIGESPQTPNITAWNDKTFARTASAPGHARRTVAHWLAEENVDWGGLHRGGLLLDALLVVSELVTNTVQHVPADAHGDWVQVRLGFGDSFVRLEVIDPGTPRRRPRFAPPLNSMAQSGRGLYLVSVVSERCGTERTQQGHRLVWAELAAGSPDRPVS
ncbi:ATP-binding protein [Nonomuraea wenchangensis]|uniref:ATP-binding protein n=1 Tax=Nonomuraea wenchangensis TaxID=568860 RepID=UPI00379782B7